MVHHAHFTERFGDDTHAFCIALGEIRELQVKCKVGINDLYLRILRGHWYADDLREVVRVALIGGGMAPVEALALVERYVDHRPLLEYYGLALKCLTVVLIGNDEGDETQKKSGNGEAMESGSEDTISTKSTETVQ
jgi:hypothetical protein